MKKMNTMESLENGSHALHMGKREVPMADDMISTESRVNLTRTNKHQRKRSVSMFCFLSVGEQHIILHRSYSSVPIFSLTCNHTERKNS
jgi:hypothetical protein